MKHELNNKNSNIMNKTTAICNIFRLLSYYQNLYHVITELIIWPTLFLLFVTSMTETLLLRRRNSEKDFSYLK